MDGSIFPLVKPSCLLLAHVTQLLCFVAAAVLATCVDNCGFVAFSTMVVMIEDREGFQGEQNLCIIHFKGEKFLKQIPHGEMQSSHSVCRLMGDCGGDSMFLELAFIGAFGTPQ
jgi:hypothetical protein